MGAGVGTLEGRYLGLGGRYLGRRGRYLGVPHPVWTDRHL